MARKWRFAAGLVGGLFVTAAAGLFLLERSITATAVRTGESAIDRFGGDRTGALIALAECESCEMRERNRAVWALGQIEDRDALPVLESLRTGSTCDHQRRLCEYEIDKAIRKIRGVNGLRAAFRR